MVIALCSPHHYQLLQEYSGPTGTLLIGGWSAWLPFESLSLSFVGIGGSIFLWQAFHYSVSQKMAGCLTIVSESLHPSFPAPIRAEYIVHPREEVRRFAFDQSPHMIIWYLALSLITTGPAPSDPESSSSSQSTGLLCSGSPQLAALCPGSAPTGSGTPPCARCASGW